MSAGEKRSLDRYVEAAHLGEAGKLEQAWKITAKMLMDNPKDVKALVTGSYLMRRMGGLPQGYHFGRAATQLAPKDSGAWTNLGHCASEMWLVDEAERCYKTGLKFAQGPHRTSLLVNLSALYIDNGRFAEAEKLAREILAKDPDHHNAQANLGFCQLATRRWEGWVGYRNTIGSDWRPRVQYMDEPEWDGTPGKVVALYADQGLGDEISFASMIPDAVDICKKVIIDCDDRLANLFKRSFPHAKVYGTKRKQEQKWDKEDWDIEASLPLGQIGEYFRLSDASFPGTPYLIPCPTRTQMWRSLWRKPAIGIAWTGGVPRTGSRDRTCALDDWLPLFGAIDAHFVSLQYQPAQNEIQSFLKRYQVDLVEYPYATLTPDYDDTAAMVASLDCIIGVPTAAIHLGGALGVKTFAMKARNNCWNYAAGLPFQPTTLIEFKESWKKTIEISVPQIASHCGCSLDTTKGSRLPLVSSVPPSLNMGRSRFLSPHSS